MCHKHDESKYMYCNVCLEEGDDHQHFKHVRITVVIKTLNQRWSQLKQNTIELNQKATNFVQEYLPLMRYLEKVSIEANNEMLAKYPMKHYLTEDIGKLDTIKNKVT